MSPGAGESGGRWRLPVVVGVVALAAGLLGFFLPGLVNRPTLDAIEPVVSATPLVEAAPSGAPASAVAKLKDVAVYYVGRDNGLLYREFRDLAPRGSRAETAVAALFDVAPLDPDYRSLWAAGSGVRVVEEGDTIIVDLPSAVLRGISGNSDALRAMDQLVYTVTAAVGDPNASKTVEVTVDGSPLRWGADLEPGKVFRRDGLVPMPGLWVTSPQNQSSVREGSTTVTGTLKAGASMPEVVVLDVATRAEVGRWPARADGTSGGWVLWRADIPLAPGSYEIRTSAFVGGVVYAENKIVTVSAAGQ